MYTYLLPASVKHEFQRMTADISCIQVFCFIYPKAHLLLSKGKPITFQSALSYHDAHIDSVMHDQARQSKILRRVLKR